MEKPSKKELNEVYYLEREIHNLQRLLNQSANNVKSPTLSKAPAKSSVPSNPTAETATKLADISLQVEELQDACRLARARIMGYITHIEDSRMRQIVTMRCLELKSWDEIAEALGGHNTATTCRVAFHREFN